MEEELSLVNPNVRDKHLWELSFYVMFMFFCLVRLIWGLKRSLVKTKGMEIARVLFS